MEGIYIDTDAQLVLVYANTHAGNDYSVYLKHGDTTDLAVATMTNKCAVRLEKVESTHEGLYNGNDCIVFQDGRKWRRVKMSYIQYRLLWCKPYVPLSFMAVWTLQGVMKRIATAVSAWRTEGKA